MQHRILQPMVLAMLLAAASTSPAQDAVAGWDPRSGDAWVDTWLEDMNRYGARHRESFVDELVRYHGASRALVGELLGSRGWAPGDVYYACALARSIGRTCSHVADFRQEHPDLGWGEVAQRLGIKPGSPGFHRLKQGFVPTYDRWARPITLDEDLQRAYPGRGGSSVAPAPPEKARPAQVAKDGASEREAAGATGEEQAQGGPERGSTVRAVRGTPRDKAPAKPR